MVALSFRGRRYFTNRVSRVQSRPKYIFVNRNTKFSIEYIFLFERVPRNVSQSQTERESPLTARSVAAKNVSFKYVRRAITWICTSGR